MANQKPTTFTAAADSQVTLDTEWYSARLGGGAPAGNYRATLRQIKSRFQSEGLAYRQEVSITPAANSFDIPSGRVLEGIVLIGSASAAFNIGTTDGGSELASGTIAADGHTISMLWRYFSSTTAIYISGTFTAIFLIR